VRTLLVSDIQRVHLYLTSAEIVVQRVAVVMFGMDNKSSDDTLLHSIYLFLILCIILKSR